MIRPYRSPGNHINPREVLTTDALVRRDYYQFYDAHAHLDDPDTAIVSHGMTDTGEVVLATQTGHDYDIATFHLGTRAVTLFKIPEHTYAGEENPYRLGEDDHTEIEITALDPETSREIELTLSRNGNILHAPDDHGHVRAHRLADVRLVTTQLAHLAERDQLLGFPISPALLSITSLAHHTRHAE